jgi:hypothetical protein
LKDVPFSYLKPSQIMTTPWLQPYGVCKALYSLWGPYGM